VGALRWCGCLGADAGPGPVVVPLLACPFQVGRCNSTSKNKKALKGKKERIKQENKNEKTAISQLYY